MCCLRNIAICVTSKKVWLPDRRQMDRQMPDKVIPMCRYASQVTQQVFIAVFTAHTSIVSITSSESTCVTSQPPGAGIVVLTGESVLTRWICSSCSKASNASSTPGWRYKVNYRILGIFRIWKFWQKWRLTDALNFQWVLFSLFEGLSMKTYNRVYILLCLFLVIPGTTRTQWKLNPCENFPIYGNWILYLTRISTGESHVLTR